MNISKNKLIGWGIVGILVLVGVFFAGASYGVKQLRALQASTGTAYSGARTRGAGGFGGMTIGQIISKDATSITVQVMNGNPASAAQGGSATPSQSGSKIIFLDSNTKISKTATGSLTDLVVGTQVSVAGATNADGSINATTVQIRPNVPQGAKVQ